MFSTNHFSHQERINEPVVGQPKGKVEDTYI